MDNMEKKEPQVESQENQVENQEKKVETQPAGTQENKTEAASESFADKLKQTATKILTKIKANKAIVIASACVVVVGVTCALVLPKVLHKHNFASDWSNDTDKHWHAATCQHTDEKADEADHSYENACDTTCDVCGATRQFVGHTFTNACDPTCDTCGATRNISHTPGADDGDCTTDIKCSVCGTVTTAGVAAHTYTNACDATCDVCGTTRTAEAHVPGTDDGDCTTAVNCTVCGAVTTPAKSGHTGGVATCLAKAKCSLCHKEYGDFAAHTPEADDDDCTTAVLCSVCHRYEFVPARDNHIPNGTVATPENPIKCSNCEYIIEAYSHTHADGVLKTGKAATCSEFGWNNYYKCAYCNDVFEDAACLRPIADFEAWKLAAGKIDKIAHTPEADDGDCTTAINCSKCGEVATAGAADHTYTNGCDTDCNVCGKTRTPIHTYDQEVDDALYLKTPATATTNAVYYKSCICGAKSSDDTFELEKIDTTVTFTDYSKEYDGIAIDPSLLFTTTSDATAEIRYKVKGSMTFNMTEAPKDAGEYEIRIKLPETATHKATQIEGEFVISKKTLTLTYHEFVYGECYKDGVDKDGYTIWHGDWYLKTSDGIVAADEGNIYLQASFGDKDVRRNSYQGAVMCSVDGTDNYDFTLDQFTAKIVAKNLDVSDIVFYREPNGSDVIAVEFEGLEYGEHLMITIKMTNAYADASVVNDPMAVQYRNDPNVALNYTFSGMTPKEYLDVAKSEAAII